MLIVPRVETSSLVQRDYRYCDASGCYYSSWYSWQRWVVAGALLLVAILLLISCACLSARRRRRRGLRPYYGTAWIAPPPAYDVNNIGTNNHSAHTGPQHGGQTYPSGQQYASYGNNNNSPPEYAPPANGYYNREQPGTTNPQSGYEMGGVGGSNGYTSPRSPPQAHVTKY